MTGQKRSKQHPYGVSVRSSVLIESLARADLVRFVRLIRTYLHRTIPHFGSARQPARAFHPFSTPFTSLPRQAEAAYLAYLATFLYFFLQRLSQHREERTCGERRHEQNIPSFQGCVRTRFCLGRQLYGFPEMP